MNNVQKLLTYMEKENLEAFYISSPANVRYISGYTGDDSYLVITKNKKYFITDPRYTEQAAEECPDYQIYNWRAYKYIDISVSIIPYFRTCRVIMSLRIRFIYKLAQYYRTLDFIFQFLRFGNCTRHSL